MKRSDLESKAKQRVPSYCHPPESPVVNLSDLQSKWPRDKERFQVILDLRHTWQSFHLVNCCFLTNSEIVTLLKTKHFYYTASFLSLSSWVWHIIRNLRSLIVSDWNNSAQYQLWWAHGSPFAFTTCRHDCQHLMERPCHPTAQVQERCRGATLFLFIVHIVLMSYPEKIVVHIGLCDLFSRVRCRSVCIWCICLLVM